ncbi:MAG: IS701 family transposase [Thermoplasmata archaeon]
MALSVSMKAAPSSRRPPRSPFGSDGHVWIPGVREFFVGYDDLFDIGVRSAETQTNARDYVHGLFLKGERKSMEPLARRAPESGPDRVQNFITYSPWDWERVQERTVERMAPLFADPWGLVALDDTAFPKQGDDSVGVASQWCGTRGKTANCQVGVSAQYIQPGSLFSPDLESFPIGMRLYLPKERAEDAAHREKCGVPSEVVFEEKWRIGLSLVERVRRLRVMHRAVVADADYGRVGEFRRQLREWKEPYVLGVQPENCWVLPLGEGWRGQQGQVLTPRRCAEIAAKVPPSQWKKVYWSTGATGPMYVEAVHVRAAVCEDGEPTDEEVWVVFEKRDNETKAYLAWGFDGLTVQGHVRLIRGRWPIEQGYPQMKGELGLDHFEGRSWLGWHHHVTLVMAGYAFLMQERQKQALAPPETSGKPRRRLPTIPQVRLWLQVAVALRILRMADELPSVEGRRAMLAYLCQMFDLPIEVQAGDYRGLTMAELPRWLGVRS